jgi:threonine/homoserine efflux transporter RhtA
VVRKSGTVVAESLSPTSCVQLIPVAIAYPLLPYALEMAAFRRMSAHRFGVLKSGEPVVVVGFVARGH